MVFKKYIQRPLLLFCILLLVTTVVFFPVSAADVNGNTFFDIDDYSTVSVNGSSVNINVSTPTSWYNSQVSSGSTTNYFTGNQFNVDFIQGSIFRMVFNPFTNKFSTPPGIGENSRNGLFMDLKTIPRNSSLSFSIDFLFTNFDYYSIQNNNLYITILGNDGKFSKIINVPYDMDIINVGTDQQRVTFTFLYNMSSLDLSSSDVGLGIRWSFNYKLLANYNTITFVNISPLHLNVTLNDLQYNVHNEQIVRDKVSNIDKQLGDLITGTPEQNEAVDGAVDQMQQAGDDLKDLGSSMSNVPKPDPGDINVSIDQFVSPGTMLAYTQPFLSLWENPTMLSMLIIVLTLVLVSWVMFGKKGG